MRAELMESRREPFWPAGLADGANGKASIPSGGQCSRIMELSIFTVKSFAKELSNSRDGMTSAPIKHVLRCLISLEGIPYSGLMLRCLRRTTGRTTGLKIKKEED